MPAFRWILLWLGLWLAPAMAEARTVHGGGWSTEPVTIAVVGEHGDTLPTAMHHGTTFVAGELGERYEIVLTNRTGERLEVVVSVDGRDVLTGGAADFRRQRGYVLAPFGTVTIDGFRRTMDRVAAFRFADVEDSFAARRGMPNNVGVIGFAVFRERAVAEIAQAPRGRSRTGASATPSKRPSASRDDAATSTSRAKKSTAHHRRSTQLGTEAGETRISRVRTVAFMRNDASRPDFSSGVSYDSLDRLAARGVTFTAIAVRPAANEPDPWPGARDDGMTRRR